MFGCRLQCKWFQYIVKSRLLSSSTISCKQKGVTVMSNLFTGEKHADLYSKYRPVYPESVLETIEQFCQSSGGSFKYAVDLGCGSGQSTLGLLKYFDKVLGTDVSAAQISKTPADNPNAKFEVGSAEDLSYLENGCVDLLTVAQAIHWIDLNRFYPEVERVLNKNGVLAIYGYGNVGLDKDAASQLVSTFYSGTLDGFWNPKRRHIDTHYQNISPPPFSQFTREDSLKMVKKMPLSAFVGYLNSWSAYNDLMKQQPGSRVLEKLHTDLLSVYANDSGSTDPEVEASWPLFILMAIKSVE